MVLILIVVLNFVQNLIYLFFSYIQLYYVTVDTFATNGNSFKCKKCGRVYQTKSSLNSHVKVICGKLSQFKCSVCNQRTFKQKGNYKLHLLRVYNILMFD